MERGEQQTEEQTHRPKIDYRREPDGDGEATGLKTKQDYLLTSPNNGLQRKKFQHFNLLYINLLLA